MRIILPIVTGSMVPGSKLKPAQGQSSWYNNTLAGDTPTSRKNAQQRT
eukprot:CAMPEP_0195644672 /NCGR_PEP_ID=MMETSP0815-20121206/28521_1 /TAXON_ID=97485 /ORGANISM="Prymnesium parvum, Strain Texoma1" /LENGTH=47 /DNA_ID= /DNA_START= /DNA_END= /DNA_ORIENTATION=